MKRAAKKGRFPAPEATDAAKRRISLKSTLIGLILLFFILVLCVQYYLVRYFETQLQTKNEEFLQQTIKTIESAIEVRVRTMEKSLLTLSHDQDVSRFLTNEEDYEQMRSSVFTNIMEAQKYGEESVSNVLLLRDGSWYGVNQPAEIDTETAAAFYHDFDGAENSEDVFFQRNGNLLTLCKYRVVTRYNLQSPGIDRIGVVATVSEVNLTKLHFDLDMGSAIQIELENRTNGERMNLFASESPEDSVLTEQIDIPLSNLSLSGYMTSFSISGEWARMRAALLVQLGGCAAFMVALLLVCSRMLIGPLDKLRQYLRTCSITSAQERLTDVGVREFNDSLEHINAMVDSIRDTARRCIETQGRLYENELEKKAILLRLYQIQINPHFVYNTMGFISSLALQRKEDEISDMAVTLANIMRYSSNLAETVHLEDEIDIVQQYMKIVKSRYPGRVRLELNVEEELFDAPSLRMILQPLVENAFKHGIQPKPEASRIVCTVCEEGDDVCLAVTDDGVGIPPDALSELQRRLDGALLNYGGWEASRGVGLFNINLRIKLHYGDRYGVTVVSEPDRFTTVTVRFAKRF